MSTVSRKAIFDVAKRLGAQFRTAADVAAMDRAIDEYVLASKAAESPPEAHPAPPSRVPEARPPSAELLTARVALELIGHEAIVQEWYLDSRRVGTWGIGVTNASGHNVDRYKDNPQPIERCLEVYLWLLRDNYIPDVAKAFDGFSLTEAQFGAALSFHYNTGKIGKASWVSLWKSGDIGAAHRSFLNWNKPPEIIGRRTSERDLFFDGEWSADGFATVYPVKKPSYRPDFGRAKRVDVRPIIEGMLR